jgi:hypothetical protein
VQRTTCPAGVVVNGPDFRPLSGPIRRDTLPLEMSIGGGRELWVVRADPPAPMVAWRLTTPSGVVFDLDRIGPGLPPPINPVSYLGEPLTVLVPNGTRSGPVRGAMTLETEGFSGGTAEITHYARTSEGSTTLDVDIWYVGASGLRAGGTLPRPVAEMLAEVGRLYATSGIRIGEVHQHEVVGALRDRFAVLEEDPSSGEMPELNELMRLSAGVNRVSLNVYLVREMERALGVSGGIPGPWCNHGTGGSGIAIAVDLIGMMPISLGRALAHETGHYFGLFHTTELEGTQVESLDDTPMCPPSRDTDGDGFLLDFECRGAGAENLMFWAASGETLSAEQLGIARSAFVLR